MDILLSIVAMTVVLGITLYHRMSLVKSVSLLTAAMLALTIAGSVGFIGWVLYVLAVAVFAVSSIRQSLISRKALALFKKVLPAMSQTEKEALDAGTVWWEAELFKGKPEWQKLHAIKAPKLSKEEQDFLDDPVNEVCAMVSDFQVTHELADLPPEVWQYLKDNKFFAMIIKKKYGGLEFSAYAQSLVLQKLTGVSGVLSSTVGVPNSLGPGELLQHYGTEEQKNHYLPRLAEGREIPCFALTSPEAGSDAGSIPDYGIVCKGEWEGEEVLGMRLTWNKRYITLAPVATVLGLAFKLRDPDGLLGDQKELGITCALIPTDLKALRSAIVTSRLMYHSKTIQPAVKTFSFRWISLLVARKWQVKAGVCWLNVCQLVEVSHCLLTQLVASKLPRWRQALTRVFVVSSNNLSVIWKA